MPKHEIDNPLYWRDEILQLMYWLTSEGFGQEFTIGDLKKFLTTGDEALVKNLELLVLYELVERVGPDKYALTALGQSEGGRSFADEFEDMIKPGHYECSEPDCDCHDPESAGEPCKHLVHSEAVN